MEYKLLLKAIGLTLLGFGGFLLYACLLKFLLDNYSAVVSLIPAATIFLCFVTWLIYEHLKGDV